jgi:hypothetical protein
VQIDRLYGWKSEADSPVRDAFKRQKDFVMTEFEQRSSQVFLQLNEQVRGAAALSCYWHECPAHGTFLPNLGMATEDEFPFSVQVKAFSSTRQGNQLT